MREMSKPLGSIEQLSLSLKTAQNMVGKATMAMDDQLLQAATEAVNNAQQELQELVNNGQEAESGLIAEAQNTLEQCEAQINEARR
jgi:hypothetical protein